MKRYGLFFGLLLGALLLAGQALAAVAPVTLFYMPASPDADGYYAMRWRASATPGVTYTLEEATDAGFTSNLKTVYTGTGIIAYIGVGTKNVPGSYYYRIQATDGVEFSTYKATTTPIVVSGPSLQTSMPTRLTFPTTDSDGKIRLAVGASATAGSQYDIRMCADAGCSTVLGSYALGLDGGGLPVIYKDFVLTNGTYYFQARATAAPLQPSNWFVPAINCVVSIPAAATGSASYATAYPTQSAAWAVGTHGNTDTKPALSLTPSSCNNCHNPTLETTTKVGCEGCHGTGSTDLSTTTATAVTSCAKCHDSHFSAVNSIATKVNGGKHNIGATTHGSASCAKCHTVEGYLQFRAGQTVTAGVANVSCAACHDSHTAALRDTQLALCTSCHQTSGFYHATSWSRDITTTHFDDPLTASGTGGVTTSPIEGYVLRTGSANPCLDCHGHEFLTETGNLDRTPFVGLSATDVVTTYYGYTKNTAHEPTLHTAWAQSAHAGGLLKAKYAAQEAFPKKNVVDGKGTVLATDTYDFAAGMAAAVKTAAVVDAAIGNAWAHYNWDDNSTRSTCQRCHTATGASNFLNNPAGYVAANNTFAHLSGWTASGGSPQNEVLYCWACHSSVESGALRNPGAITETYLGTGTGAPVATVEYPNVAASNVCMSCHLGQKVGQNVADSTGDFTNLSFINSHYLAAGSTIFNESGYEYAGQNYDGYGYHKSVGMGNAYSTGNSGPCVACHMSSAEGHSYEVVTKDDVGVITGITSTVCGNCHGGLSAATLQTSAAGFHSALVALESALEAKGIFFWPAYPYFFNVQVTTENAATTAISANAFKNWDGVYPGFGKDVMGAAFNYNLFEHDPGAYAHNRSYALKLIADSIDFLADGVVDGVGIPAGVTNVIESSAFGDATSHVSSAVAAGGNTCAGCHQPISDTFATSQHYTRQGKETFYNNNLGNTEVPALQKGFGNYVTVAYDSLPCADCHNPKAWTVGGVDTWAAETGGNPVCTDCHTNKVNGVATTAADAPIAATTCEGCHSRQVNERSMGLTDVHTIAGMGCPSCHSTSDMHGNGEALASQLAPGAISAQCETCHVAGGSYVGGAPSTAVPEHNSHLSNIACSTCHMQSVITCYGCHFDNEASDPTDPTILHAKFASGKFGGQGAASWRFLVNRVMADGSTKIYPASMQSLVADRTASNSPGETNTGWTHAAIAPYYSHSITRTAALQCSACHGTQKAIDLAAGTPVRVVQWGPAAGVEVTVSNMMASYTVKPTGVIPVPENPVGLLLMDFIDLVNPAAGPLTASGTSPSNRVLFKKDGPDSIHMPEAFVKPLTSAQMADLATPQVRP